MSRVLLPLALCCALLYAVAASAIEIDTPVLSCDAHHGANGPPEPLVFAQADSGSITLSFRAVLYPMLYTEPGLIVARNAEDLLIVRFDQQGQLTLKSTRQRSDGSPDTKASFYILDCRDALHF